MEKLYIQNNQVTDHIINKLPKKLQEITNDHLERIKDFCSFPIDFPIVIDVVYQTKTINHSIQRKTRQVSKYAIFSDFCARFSCSTDTCTDTLIKDGHFQLMDITLDKNHVKTLISNFHKKWSPLISEQDFVTHQ